MSDHVWRFDSLLRFKVKSRSRPTQEPHTVHLGAYNGNGDCTCEQFIYRLQDALEAGAEPSDKTRCSHILEARAFFCDEMVAVMARHEPNHKAKPQA